ncbi:hypothetical protein CDAR_514481 [Caerostris darwini]|uniref:Uncharacterized protein n=1 Tax=Caerostris darwini TaxID=1538125 RepID=A0AAV4UHU3_9ARAC|nr:hypothetical protein CDAR_514481 [Caerostris darwini]
MLLKGPTNAYWSPFRSTTSAQCITRLKISSTSDGQRRTSDKVIVKIASLCWKGAFGRVHSVVNPNDIGKQNRPCLFKGGWERISDSMHFETSEGSENVLQLFGITGY